jgi:hypothetical protein
MRIVYEVQTPDNQPIQNSVTSWVSCHPPNTMTFEVAGMYPSTAYNMYAQTKTGTKTSNGPTLAFTTGALPATITFPTFSVVTPAADTTYPVLLHNPIAFAAETVYPDTATDLKGNIIWYYSSNDVTTADVLTRPLTGGGFLSLQDDVAWDPAVYQEQFLVQTDLAGNIVRATNMGAIQQELLKLGSVDGGPCTAIAVPAPVGSACIGAFHHDAIQTLPNGYTATLVDIEKIFPPGTQGDTSGLPVDIIGDMIIVLNANWQVVWYWDSFNPAGGGNGYTQLPVSQTAILGETCGVNTSGCPPIFLLSSHIAPLAHDWLHANSLYYWPAPEDGNTTGGDIVWSSRHQDEVFKIDYKDGTGTGDILWVMGPSEDGHVVNFTFNNIYNDVWPWFSHQHDVGFENGGTGPVTIMDNGDTRVAPAPNGLGTGCGPNDCDSRGMALTIDVTPPMQVTPVVSFDLGGYSNAMGSAQLLANGNYFFENAIVFVLAQGGTFGFSMEIAPTPAAPQVGPADVLLDMQGTQHYRGWQMSSLYLVPTT